MGFRFLALLFLVSCATVSQQDASLENLWSKIQLQGEGRSRLEVPPEAWVFSFEANLNKTDWIMAIAIPMHGEEVFTFPGLDRTKPEVVPANSDFRFRVVQALREASQKRKLAYPQLGQDFVTYLHHVLRWAHIKSLGLTKACVAQSKNSWNCQLDNVPSSWSWDERKEEFTGVFTLRPDWHMRVVFKNLTDSVFKRVTIEITRKTELKEAVELRQEFFFR